MAEKRYVGDYPVIGIRPIIDGRRGPMKLRESLEDQTMGMAQAAKKLFEALKKENIYVRFLGGARIENYLRISIGTREEMEALISFLKTYIECEMPSVSVDGE